MTWIVSLVLSAYWFTGHGLKIGFDIVAFSLVVFGSLVASLVAGGDLPKRIVSLAKYSALTTILGILISLISVFVDLYDPTLIGPGVAIGLLSSLYGGIVYIFAYSAQQAYVGKPFSSNKIMLIQSGSSLFILPFASWAYFFLLIYNPSSGIR